MIVDYRNNETNLMPVTQPFESMLIVNNLVFDKSLNFGILSTRDVFTTVDASCEFFVVL